MADTPPPRFQVGRALLIGGFVLLSLAVIALFAPLWECPHCQIALLVEKGEVGSRSTFYLFGEGCDNCCRGRVSSYRRWWDPNYLYRGATFTK